MQGDSQKLLSHEQNCNLSIIFDEEYYITFGERSQTEEEYITFGEREQTPEDSYYDPSYDYDSDSDCVDGYTDEIPL